MIFVFLLPIFQSSSFQRFEDQPRFRRPNFFPCNLCVAVLFAFLFRCRRLFLFPVSACAPTQSRTQPSVFTHISHPSILSHTRHVQSDSWPRRGETGGEEEGEGLRMVAQSGGVLLEEMNLAPQR